MLSEKHKLFMQEALKEAQAAFDSDESPVGAVIVIGDKIVGRGRNSVESNFDPSAHAEMIALKNARKTTGDKLLSEATLYCTLEPCPMCAGAAILHRIKRIVYGASDLRWGACGTIFNIPEEEKLNHRMEIIGGVMEKECGEIMSEFFKKIRK